MGTGFFNCMIDKVSIVKVLYWKAITAEGDSEDLRSVGLGEMGPFLRCKRDCCYQPLLGFWHEVARAAIEMIGPVMCCHTDGHDHNVSGLKRTESG